MLSEYGDAPWFWTIAHIPVGYGGTVHVPIERWFLLGNYRFHHTLGHGGPTGIAYNAWKKVVKIWFILTKCMKNYTFSQIHRIKWATYPRKPLKFAVLVSDWNGSFFQSTFSRPTISKRFDLYDGQLKTNQNEFHGTHQRLFTSHDIFNNITLIHV